MENQESFVAYNENGQPYTIRRETDGNGESTLVTEQEEKVVPVEGEDGAYQIVISGAILRTQQPG